MFSFLFRQKDKEKSRKDTIQILTDFLKNPYEKQEGWREQEKIHTKKVNVIILAGNGLETTGKYGKKNGENKWMRDRTSEFYLLIG